MRRFFTRRKKYVLVFLATALAGLAVRVYAHSLIVGLSGAEPGDLLFALTTEIGRLVLPALVALLVGFILPKGFFLWGIAVVLTHPLYELMWNNRALEAGVLESSELNKLFLGQTIQIVFFVAPLCTVTAAPGAGLRLLWWWMRGESVRGRLGMFSESNNPV